MVKVELSRSDWELVMLALEDDIFNGVSIMSPLLKNIKKQVDRQEY